MPALSNTWLEAGLVFNKPQAGRRPTGEGMKQIFLSSSPALKYPKQKPGERQITNELLGII